MSSGRRGLLSVSTNAKPHAGHGDLPSLGVKALNQITTRAAGPYAGTQFQVRGARCSAPEPTKVSIPCHFRPHLRRSPELWPSATTISRPPFRSPCLRTKLSAATFWFRRKPAPARRSPTGWRLQRNLLGGAERFERAAAPLALIVAPTRELALQVHRELAGFINMPMGASSPASAAWIRAANSASLPRALTSWSARPADCAITCGAAVSTSRN